VLTSLHATMTDDGRTPAYPISDAQMDIDVGSGKWVLPILELLHHGGLRRGELRRMLGDTHQRVLTLTLQRMTAAGLITRTTLRATPPAVLYEVTTRGDAYLQAVAPLAHWAAADRTRLTAALTGPRTADVDGEKRSSDT
jgi:DNA-binding HxlR family transcriptional regulator